MEDLRLTSFEDFQDKNFGKIGTPERDAFEKEVDDALQAYRMGEVMGQRIFPVGMMGKALAHIKHIE